MNKAIELKKSAAMHGLKGRGSRLALAVTSAALASVIMGGCTTTHQINAQTEQDKDRIGNALAGASNSLPGGEVAFKDGILLPLKKFTVGKTTLGNEKTNSMRVGFHRKFTDLYEIAAEISAETGFVVSVDEDVMRPVGTSTSGAASGVSGGAGATAGRTPGTLSVFLPMTINFTGTLSGLMSYVAATYGVSWNVDGNRMRFFRTESRTFKVVALPGDMHLSTEVGSSASAGGSSAGTGSSGSSSAGSSSGSLSNSGVKSTGANITGLSVWKGLETSIKQMLNPNGQVLASPATGTISVTDTPAVIARVSDFIKVQNDSLSKMVSVNVKVLSVQLKDGQQYGVNWDAVYRNISSNTNLTFKGALPVAGAFVLSNNGTGATAGTKAMIDALSTQGRVTEVTSTQLVTMNNQPVPINVGQSRSYVASTSTSQTANVGSVSTITPGVVQTGFAMSLVPNILDKDSVLMQYSMDISSLLALDTFGSGNSMVQLPTVASNNFIQRVRMRAGETLVVAGFDQKDQSANSQGVGQATNPLVGAQNTKTNQTMMVVLIQPTVGN